MITVPGLFVLPSAVLMSAIALLVDGFIISKIWEEMSLSAPDLAVFGI